ncbi:signal peptidase I [Aeromicrobium sp. Marseille-Q0843]|uniref:Signal peptidase I n=1 Tax=Aeromicrobium phoceense TaxID=2754045 RepID=A0A838XEJ2_9ACTN|nr:signal peptidase I [Aeromicrobium phoceense]MBA4607218.1 signal peptidase I [Aeromicrobium phoceense]
MKHLTRAARLLGRGVTTLLLLVVTVASVAYIAPSLFGFERYVITGGSMSGTFEKGSIAFERPVPVADLAVGDVITYLPPADSGVSTLVTHRITQIEPGESGARLFTTQGDANPDPDPWEFSLLSGTQPVVEQTVPYVGYAFMALADRETRMLVTGVPAGLIALIALVDLGRALRRPEDDDAPAPLTPTAGAPAKKAGARAIPVAVVGRHALT